MMNTLILFSFSAWLFVSFSLLFRGSFISNICDKRLGSFNLNGARDDVKRASLFSLINAKRLNVIFLQETHSTPDNEAEWKRELRGEVFFKVIRTVIAVEWRSFIFQRFSMLLRK